LTGPAPDPFGTAALRAAVLDAWAASPTRFREDANAEEDLLLGGYADAWFVELAQNAADAARAAGTPGRMTVAVVGDELRVGNTGAPLDAAGVAALASLRASAKRDDAGSAGRFGVGFAAVLALTDAPRVVSRTGAAAFSATRTAAAVADLPGPAAELARRDVPPVLRLVWPSDETPADGVDTEVRLPLRPGLDAAALLARARADAPGLLLALPGLAEVEVAGEVVRREERAGGVVVDGRWWRTVRRSGVLDAAADAAAEQRSRTEWSVVWALPEHPLGPDVLHAPTPTAEGLSLPARLIATLPLEPDRRRHRPGPVTDRVLAEAVAAYLDLVHAVPPGDRAALVPEPGFPRSALDGELRDLLVDALAADPWLPGGLAPDRAEWLDLPGAEPVLDLLDEAGVTGIVPGPVPALLRMRRLGPAALVERLFGIEQPPSWWRALYAALADAVDEVPGLRDDLRALPVPLVDGRTAAGPPTALVPSAALPALPPLPGLHVVHPDAVHPLLLRLGAAEAGPGALLEHPAVLAAVEGSLDDAGAGLDPLPLARAVLGLLAAHGRGPAGPAAGALRALALPADDGTPARADELLLPDAALRPLLAPDAGLGVLDPAFAATVDRDALVALGVLDGFALVVDDDPAGPDPDLDDAYTWWDSTPEPPRRVRAVRDLDLVADDAWPAALALLAADRGTRAALLEPGGHTGWWLARHARLDGERPGQRRLPSATALAGLYDPVGIDGVDEAVLAAAGVRAGLAVADAEDAADLLARLGDPRRRPDAALVARAHVVLTEAVAAGRVDPADLDPPERVRALDGSVVGVDVAVVLDAPWPAAVLPPGELVAGGDPGLLAELLDLPPATDVVAGAVQGTGREVAWAEVGEVVVACHTLGVDVPAGVVVVHDELRVLLTRPVAGPVRVPVWPDGRGSWHTDDPLRALVADLAVLDTDV
jgi:hypothetical protein